MSEDRQNLGFAALAGAYAGDQPLETFNWPSDIRARLAELTQRADALALDISSYTPRPEQAAAWSRFAAAFGTWKAGLDALRAEWADKIFGAGGASYRVESYAQQLEQWRVTYEALAARPATMQPAPGPNDDKPKHAWIPYAIGAAGALGAVWILSKAYGSDD